jgi:hypothetical protein
MDFRFIDNYITFIIGIYFQACLDYSFGSSLFVLFSLKICAFASATFSNYTLKLSKSSFEVNLAHNLSV